MTNNWLWRSKGNVIYVQVWCSGSQGTVDRGITASQEQWDGHFFAGIDFIKTSVSKG